MTKAGRKEREKVEKARRKKPYIPKHLGLSGKLGVVPYRDPLHTLRKSAIDDWAKQGYPPNVVKEWAGHASLMTTMMFYAKVETRDVQRAATTPMFKSDVTQDVTGSSGSA